MIGSHGVHVMKGSQMCE